MEDQSGITAQSHYFLQPGYIFMAGKAIEISAVLGSCVAVCLYDKKKKVGCMNHFEFPYASDRKNATARYGNAAMPALIRMILEGGSKIKDLEAQLFGGAYNPEICPEDIGKNNIFVARRILENKKIHIVSDDVGGEKGRKIIFNTGTSEVAVFRVEKLRKGDWYPYEKER